MKNNGEGVSFEAEGGVGKQYLDKLKVKIFNIWQYPADAIHKGEQGKTTISFVLNDKGELMDMGVLVSSGSHSLDSAAMAAVKEGKPIRILYRRHQRENTQGNREFRLCP